MEKKLWLLINWLVTRSIIWISDTISSVRSPDNRTCLFSKVLQISNY